MSDDFADVFFTGFIALLQVASQWPYFGSVRAISESILKNASNV